LPDQIVAVVSEAEEAVQGNTVTSVQKKAWISSGLEIQVPQFIKKGDKVLVNTATGEYVGRTH
jgi:elongation factor P